MTKPTHNPLPIWSIALPIAAWLVYFIGIKGSVPLQLIGGAMLIGSVLSAVHHAEVVAHKVGEPFGTIILALAITVLEVGLIVSMMILTGLLGVCLLIGGLKHREQFFNKKSVSTALVTLISILVLTLVLPNFTTSTPSGSYNTAQLLFIAVASFVLYFSFILTQTVRHRDYFLADDEDPSHHAEPPPTQIALASLVCLVVCLGVVIALAKALSPAIESMVVSWGAPKALVGVIIAAVVLMPESLAALTAARRNRLQTSINLALGSALASIGLTIPAVALVCLIYDIDVMLGLDAKSMLLLGLSTFTVMLSLHYGKTNMLYGIVLLVNLAAYVFTVIVP